MPTPTLTIESIQFKRGTAAALAAWLSIPQAGEPVFEIDTNKLKIGDGIHLYKDLPYLAGSGSGAGAVYQVECARGANHLDAIAAVCPAPSTGDFAIVKELIAEDKRQYTAYIYYETVWEALDGNYDAENVYFSDDLTYTAAIGVLPKPASSATLAAKGKNVKAVLSSILAKREQPQKVDPAVTLTGTQTNEDLEIGTTVSKSGTLVSSLSAGSYTYGPATGVFAGSWFSEIKYVAGRSDLITAGASASTPYSYSFRLGTDGDTVKVNYKATATHNAGAVAKDNLGDNSDPVVQISAGSKTKEVTTTYTSYRNIFYGTRTDKEALDSAKIRQLSKIKEAAKPSNSLKVTIPLGALRTVIAVPYNRTVTSIKDENASMGEILGSFVVSTINVEGAESYSAIAYKVYTLDVAKPNDTLNYFHVTVE